MTLNRSLLGVALASALSLVGMGAQATIVNISAYDATALSNIPAPTSVAFAAGTYQVSWIGKNSGGLYDGWTYQSGNTAIREAFTAQIGSTSYIIDKYDGTNNYYKSYATVNDALAAFASGPYAVSPEAYTFPSSPNFFATQSLNLVLPTATTINFSVPDYLFWDNTGGVSLNISAVNAIPEPGTYALLFAGFGITGVITRRRAASNDKK